MDLELRVEAQTNEYDDAIIAIVENVSGEFVASGCGFGGRDLEFYFPATKAEALGRAIERLLDAYPKHELDLSVSYAEGWGESDDEGDRAILVRDPNAPVISQTMSDCEMN
jgi:hypothetical protein